ncbi:helix-turn-helix domain-containing protein [Haloarcula brevis]|uniref:helix-turn-helix domain-containing protein n=1 Tax=Haloarcula brevis TaxID=3111453 RepID=UPI00300EA257
MIEYTFEITHENCWTETMNDSFPEVSATIIYSYQLFGTSITMIEATGVSADRVDPLVAWLGDHPIMTAARLISYDDGRETAYVSLAGEYDPDTDTEPVLNVLLRNRCFPTVPPTVTDGTEHWNVLASDHESVSQTHEELQSLGSVEVNSLKTPNHDQFLTGLAEIKEAIADLSPRQQEILASAVEAGYYDSPRSCGIEDLAATDSANTSTVGEHLRRSEAKILNAVGSLLRDDAAGPSAGTRANAANSD